MSTLANALAPYMAQWRESLRSFAEHDAERRSGTAGDPVAAAIENRRREGALMASLLGPVAPVATVPVALAGAGWEGAKALRLTDLIPGHQFQRDATTSPASIENIIALLRGFTEPTAQPLTRVSSR